MKVLLLRRSSVRDDFSLPTKGGPAAFIQNFLVWGAKNDVYISLLPEAETYDAAVVCLFADPKLLTKLKEKGTKIILRLPGPRWDTDLTLIDPYLSIKKMDHYIVANKEHKMIMDMRDAVVYQSKWTQEMGHKYLGKHPNEHIIYNGVDLDVFSPAAAHRKEKQLLAFGPATKTKMRLDWSERVAKELKLLPLRTHNYIGSLSKNDMKWFYCSGQVLLYPAYRDPCPHKVIEALACGTPVVCSSTGGTPELYPPGAVCQPDTMEPMGMNTITDYPEYNMLGWADRTNRLLYNWNYFSQMARSRAEKHYSLDKMCKEYIDASQ